MIPVLPRWKFHCRKHQAAEFSVAVKDWHVGKLGLLWGWGVVLIAFALNLVQKIDNPFLGFALLLGVVSVPILLTFLTWRWLSGKEQQRLDG